MQKISNNSEMVSRAICPIADKRKYGIIVDLSPFLGLIIAAFFLSTILHMDSAFSQVKTKKIGSYDSKYFLQLHLNSSIAYENYKNKKYTDVPHYYWKVIQLDTTYEYLHKFPNTFRYLAHSYLELNQPDSAIIVYEIGVKILPNDSDLRNDYEKLLATFQESNRREVIDSGDSQKKPMERASESQNVTKKTSDNRRAYSSKSAIKEGTQTQPGRDQDRVKIKRLTNQEFQPTTYVEVFVQPIQVLIKGKGVKKVHPFYPTYKSVEIAKFTISWKSRRSTLWEGHGVTSLDVSELQQIIQNEIIPKAKEIGADAVVVTKARVKSKAKKGKMEFSTDIRAVLLKHR